MGSFADLRQEQIGDYNDLIKLYRAGKPSVTPLEQSIMVDLYKELGGDIMRATVEQCCLNGWARVSNIQKLARMMAKHSPQKTNWAIERANALGYHSLDSVEGILNGSIPPYRKKEGEPVRAESDTTKRARSYPTPTGVHTEGTAARWLRERGRSAEEWPQYFERAGQDEVYNWNLYQLKAEYR